jgi:MFS family permease
VWLLALLALINYVDRGNLSTAAPVIRDELGLTNSQLGILLSAFFWTYVPFQPFVGWLAQKFNTYLVLAIALIIWAMATTLTGFGHGFAMLLGLRLLLGLGECAAFPCISKLYGQHLPAHRMGFANGLVAMGIALGPAFGIFFGGEIMASQGWRSTFVLFGMLSLLWLIPWLWATRALARNALETRSPDDEPTFGELLSKRALWGTTLGHMFGLYAFYFVITWLPTYLVKAQGLSISNVAILGGEIYLAYAASCLVTGWATDHLIKRGVSSTWARKTCLVAGPLLVCASMTAAALGDARLAIAGLFGTGIAFGFSTPNIYAVAQTVAGPHASGKWVGFMNGLANLSGVISPMATGFIIDATGSFYAAFATAAAISVLSSLSWGLLVWRVEEVPWKRMKQATDGGLSHVLPMTGKGTPPGTVVENSEI